MEFVLCCRAFLVSDVCVCVCHNQRLLSSAGVLGYGAELPN